MKRMMLLVYETRSTDAREHSHKIHTHSSSLGKSKAAQSGRKTYVIALPRQPRVERDEKKTGGWIIIEVGMLGAVSLRRR